MNRNRRLVWRLGWLVAWAVLAGALPAQTDSDLRQDVVRSLQAAVKFYRSRAARHGGYVYYYSLDLRERGGEGKADPETIFVQPPGTPTVGLAYLAAFSATGDRDYLDAAREAALALVDGQLQSGGWTQVIHFGPARRLGKYRHRPGGSWNVSSLDDGQSQAALEMLVRIDQALDFQDAKIHDAARYGLDALLKAQFPNGGFPQVWTQPVEPRPVLKARLPDYDWRHEGRLKNYWDEYTLNDNLAGSVADTLITAHRVYREERYLTALQRLGDFLLLAQLPEPQPGWCQQYNREMIPIWARKFEPPAISGGESQDVLETLLKISGYTGRKKYTEPIPRALAYLEKCLLRDGRLARFYEFQTNRPLYMDANYQLTYDDTAAPSHYGWKVCSRLPEIAAALRHQREGTSPPPPSTKERETRVREIIQALDGEGRWVSTYTGQRLVGQPKFSPSYRYLSSAVFSRNVELLAEYLATLPKSSGPAGPPKPPPPQNSSRPPAATWGVP